ncbi:MAG: hypothetical protein ACR2KL_00845 [Nocardioidaceae bacterium]
MLLALRILAAVALLVAGILHLKVASQYDYSPGTLLSIGDEFRLQFAATVVAALLLLVVRRRTWPWWPALLVAGATLVAVVASVYVQVPAIGPLPAFPHEPWSAEAKVASAVAEAVAVVLAIAGLLSAGSGRRRRGRQRRPDVEQSRPSPPRSA